MPKKRVAEVNKEQDEKLKAFLEDYEKMQTELIKKHEMRLIPEIREHKTGHSITYQAVYAVEKVNHIHIGDDEKKPEADRQPDTDNQLSEE